MLFDVFEDESVHLSMELCHGGCLTDRVKAAPNKHLPHEEVSSAMRSLTHFQDLSSLEIL